ncbi:MAG: hypothetical protein JXA74_18430 [Anaerolineae bacterium]|nr:hypothetical protein [Anaerolineae bacterium]
MSVIRRGKVAFHSHLIDNAASEALASSLGVTECALVTGYEGRTAPPQRSTRCEE